MDARIVNALIAAVMNTLKALLNVTPAVGKPGLLKEIKPKYDMVTVIGFSGGVDGNLIYSFSPTTALKIVSKMMGLQYDALDDLAMSAVGELGNMIAGALAMNLEKVGCRIVISPPTVVTGKNLKLTVEGLAINLLTSIFDAEDTEIILATKGSMKCQQ